MLRLYQKHLIAHIFDAWARGATNVLAVLPTGAGKTVTFTNIVKSESAPVCAIAHRQELVVQISLGFARAGIIHRVLGDTHLIELCVSAHLRDTGRSYFSEFSQVVVVGVDTLIRRKRELHEWADRVSLWVQDEGHHLLKDNKWGRAVAMFPNARGLGVTATPFRLDGKRLDVFDRVISGESMVDLIDAGYLTKYKLFAPPSDFERPEVKSGDFRKGAMQSSVLSSTITGDIIACYKKIAMGKLGITFMPTVATAQRVSDKFNEAGIPAAAISSNTGYRTRSEYIQKFKRRELLQLVNVDIFGEGFDLPAIEVVSFGRPTESLGVYMQQFGRVLRPMEGKEYGFVIDHVKNIQRHGLPDQDVRLTLGAKKSKKSNTPIWTCPGCTAVWGREIKVCQDKNCNYVQPERKKAASPNFVDGDLFEVSSEVVRELQKQKEAASLDEDSYRGMLIGRGAPRLGVLAHCKRHRMRRRAQLELRDLIKKWGDLELIAPHNRDRLFFYEFGVDRLTACSLNLAGTQDLLGRVKLSVFTGESIK